MHILSVVGAFLAAKAAIVHTIIVIAAVQGDVSEDDVGGCGGCKAEVESDWLHGY